MWLNLVATNIVLLPFGRKSQLQHRSIGTREASEKGYQILCPKNSTNCESLHLLRQHRQPGNILGVRRTLPRVTPVYVCVSYSYVHGSRYVPTSAHVFGLWRCCVRACLLCGTKFRTGCLILWYLTGPGKFDPARNLSNLNQTLTRFVHTRLQQGTGGQGRMFSVFGCFAIHLVSVCQSACPLHSHTVVD